MDRRWSAIHRESQRLSRARRDPRGPIERGLSPDRECDVEARAPGRRTLRGAHTMTGPTEHFSILSDLRGAWATRGHGPTSRAVRKAGEAVRERLAGGPQVVALLTLPITTLAYSTKYAL